MTTLLHLNVSPRGERSTSRRAGQYLRDQLSAHHGPLTVIDRDLGGDPLPVIDAAFTEANIAMAAGSGNARASALALSETLIAELESSDMLLITTPMHNFTVPATLKTWIDLVVRPARTFQSTPQGKQGLLRDRPVLAVVSCGGAFHSGPGSQMDHFTPYLKYVLGTIGLTRVEVLRMENMNRGPDQVAQGFDLLRAWCDAALPAMAT
ncbi:MAG: NAD(P)H-dependent oxidoreductase [Cupriavidus sp.]|nr:NAD(P)H-dependent oxidoreductase [Cupriavidus sp.]